MTDETGSTLKEMSHTNPFTENSFGDAMVFHRGLVAADGGEAPRREGMTGDGSEPDPDRDGSRLGDIDHTPPHGEGVNRVYERGTEGRDESA